MSLNELRDEALRIATEHGFKDATVGEDLMLIVSEAAEAMEDHREGKVCDVLWYVDEDLGCHSYQNHGSVTPWKPIGIPSEIADIIIRCLHFSGKHNIDIDLAVREKMAYNNSRPFKHGKIL